MTALSHVTHLQGSFVKMSLPLKNKKTCIIFNCMYVYKYVHMNVGIWETMYVRSPRGGGVSGSHEPPGMATEN